MRALPRTVLAALTVALLLPGQAAVAATGPYQASADAELLHVDAVDIVGVVEVADVGVAPVSAAVDTEAGIEGGLTGRATGTNVDASLLDAIPLEDLLVVAEATAPEDSPEPVVEELLPLDASPLLNLGVGQADALARDVAGVGACPALDADGFAVTASGGSQVADLAALPEALGDGDTVGLDNGGDDTVDARATTGLLLPDGATTRSVVARATTQVTSVDVLGGSLQVDVVGTPTLQAVASGTSGGGAVTYDAPLVRVNGTELIGTDEIDTTVQLIPGVDAPAIVRLELGTLTDVVVAEDGTAASGSAKVLGIDVLDVTGTITLASVDVGPMSVAATSPVGGIDCGDAVSDDDPLAGVRVDVTTADVDPGGSYDVVVQVPNRGECTVEDLEVVLEVDGPAGTTLRDPVPSDGTVSDTTVTWSDQGPLAPGESLSYVVTVDVPDDAPLGATFSQTGTATGDCDGEEASGTDTVAGVPKVTGGTATGCDVGGSNVSSSNEEVRRGDQFDHYVHLFNQGDATCESLTVSIDVPQGTTFVSCTPACTVADGQVTWVVEGLPAGSGETLVATFEVDDDAPIGDDVGTTVTITGDDDVTDSTDEPVVSDTAVPNPLDAAERDDPVAGAPDPAPDTGPVVVQPDLPRTGGGAAALAMAALLGAAALRRRA